MPDRASDCDTSVLHVSIYDTWESSTRVPVSLALRPEEVLGLTQQCWPSGRIARDLRNLGKQALGVGQFGFSSLEVRRMWLLVWFVVVLVV
jgi:hypothetical protein